MPLTKSSSNTAFRSNVSEMVRAGHPQKQALAASFRNQREARAKGYADGGYVPGGFTGRPSSFGDRLDRLPQSEMIEDRRDEPYEPDEAQKAREMAAMRVSGLRRQASRPMEHLRRASGGRVAVKNMLDEAAGKLEDGLVSIGKAGGGGLSADPMAMFNQASGFIGQQNPSWARVMGSPQAQQLLQRGSGAISSLLGRWGRQPAAAAAPAPASSMRLGYADGGDLPYRGGEITPWYVRSEANQMRRAASGPIQSIVPGRTDALSMSVKRGSYVVPADVVSGMPGAQGNSSAGHKILENMFKTGPYGMKLPGGGRAGSGFPRAPALPRADGGLVGGPEPEDDLVDIDAAGGEHILDPEVAQALGNGDPEMGFKILDNFVKKIRDMHIKTLKKLPGPKQS